MDKLKAIIGKRKNTDNGLSFEQNLIFHAALTFLALGIILTLNFTYETNIRTQKEIAHAQAESFMSETAHQIQEYVSTTDLLKDLYLVYGDSFLNDFYKICDRLTKSHITIGSMYYAPNGIIQYSYPKQVDASTGGFAMLYDPIQGPKAMLAKTTHKTTIAGPHKLVEGGEGFIIRNPIYDSNGIFEGFTILVFDKDQFFDSINEVLDEDFDNYYVALWKETDITALTDDNGYIYTNAPKAVDLKITTTLHAANDTWYLAIEPVDGWYNLASMASEIRNALILFVTVATILYISLNSVRRRDRLKQEIIKAIQIDSLTGIYTKEAFFLYAKRHLDIHAYDACSIYLTDFRNFKLINRYYGEETGDRIIKAMASFLEKEIENGVFARYNADRFIFLIRTGSLDEKDFIKRASAEIKKQVNVKNFSLRLGVYEHVDREIPLSRMCSHAIMALKSIDNDYSRSVAFYEGYASQRELRAKNYETQFQKAIEEKQFEVWFQPKVSTKTRKITGAEALVRWRSDEGMISPGLFLPIFEEDGLISQLDRYVFEEVCRFQAKRLKNGQLLFPVSVNLSRNSFFHEEIAQTYVNLIEDYGIEKKYLPIEITESAMIDNREIKPYMDALYQAGFTLHMDDFGSGRSSLSSLTNLHFSVVKIDKSLIDQIGDRQGELTLTYTISLIKELGLTAVAEGVEKSEQIEFLAKNSCDMIQGYVYSKPLTEKQFDRFIEGRIETSEDRLRSQGERQLAGIELHMMNMLLNAMPGGFLIYDANGDEKIIYSNPYIWELFGYDNEKDFMNHVGSSFKGFVCKEELDNVESSINSQVISSSNGSDYLEYNIVRKDGTKIPVIDFGHIEHEEDGDYFYVFIARKHR